MDGQLVRLYPIPFRYLEHDQMFPKYSVIQAAVRRRPAQKDSRPDSYEPDPGTIKVLEAPSSPADWDRRRARILPLVSPSMEEVQRQYDQTKKSIGLFKPAEVEMAISAVDPHWTGSQRQALMQQHLWFGKPKPLAKLPFEFRYAYRCGSADCRGHEQLITDWELGAAFLQWRSRYGEEEAVEKIKEKWVRWMWQERDSYLIVGTTHRYATFIVVGVFYPPRTPVRQTFLNLDGN